MSDDAKPPAPGECHPFYADQREDLERTLNSSRVPYVATLHATGENWLDREYTQLTLTRRKAWGPAPYVGAPFFYVWHFWSDDQGRGVGGESRIVYDTASRRWLDYFCSDPPANEPSSRFGMDAP